MKLTSSYGKQRKGLVFYELLLFLPLLAFCFSSLAAIWHIFLDWRNGHVAEATANTTSAASCSRRSYIRRQIPSCQIIVLQATKLVGAALENGISQTAVFRNPFSKGISSWCQSFLSEQSVIFTFVTISLVMACNEMRIETRSRFIVLFIKD